jgi:hypothetical protein
MAVYLICGAFVLLGLLCFSRAVQEAVEGPRRAAARRGH